MARGASRTAECPHFRRKARKVVPGRGHWYRSTL